MQIEAAGLEQKNFSVYIFSSVRYINRNLQPAQPLLPQRSESSALGSKVRFTSELTLSLSLSPSFYFSLSILKGVGKAGHRLLEAANTNPRRQQMLDLLPHLGTLWKSLLLPGRSSSLPCVWGWAQPWLVAAPGAWPWDASKSRAAGSASSQPPATCRPAGQRDVSPHPAASLCVGDASSFLPIPSHLGMGALWCCLQWISYLLTRQPVLLARVVKRKV